MVNIEVSGVKACIDTLTLSVSGMVSQAQAAGEEIAALLKDYAKNNHPWQNVTGETEATTDAQVVEATTQLVTVALFTGTDYSQFLELARDGKWAWLWPAIIANEGAIMEIARKYLSDVRKV